MKERLTRVCVRMAASTVLLTVVCTPSVSADIISDLASATILEDFTFADAAGTAIEAAANSANPGNMFDADTDNMNVVTNGMGQLDASGKDNTSFGSNYVDVSDFSTGRYFGVMHLAWDFDTTVFDPAQDEEIRLTFINNDPRGTQVTAQVEIQRNGLTDLEINGTATNGDALGPAALSISQTDFVAVLDADLDNDMYQVHYSADGGSSFTSLGPGGIDPGRILNAVRMVINEDYSDDTLLIDRVYLARAIPEPSSLAIWALGFMGLLIRRGR